MIKVTVNTWKEDEAVDWSKSILVVSKEGGLVLLTSGKCYNNTFEGTSLKSNGFGAGYVSNWDKDRFKPFRGTVTIEG